MSSPLEWMRAIDVAWNARDWDAYAAILDDALIAYAAGDAGPHGKSDHVERARAFCEVFPDNRVHIETYLELFASADGTKTCSVARLTGTMTRDWKTPTGKLLLTATGRAFDVTFATVCTWQSGRIAVQAAYADSELLLRHVRGEISPSPVSRNPTKA